MDRESLRKHCEKMCKMYESAPSSNVYMEHKLVLDLLEQTRWIPISERLPASDEDVLVTNGRGIYVGWIVATDKGWRVDSESEYFMNDIVAWMPLPQPYKPQKKECADCKHYGKLSLDCGRCDDNCSMFAPQESEDKE